MSEMMDKREVDEKNGESIVEVETVITQEGEETMREEKGYTVNPDLKKLIERTDEEYERLKEAIRRDGTIREDYVVWKETGFLVDGHGRDQIYDELREELGEEFNIKPPGIVLMSFANQDEAKLWMARNQFAHRNMNSFRRIVTALQSKSYFEEKARANKKAGVSPKLGKGVDANDEVAKLAGVKSAETVRKVERILKKKGNPDVALAINALFKDEKGFSIDGVYKKYCAEPTVTKPSPKPKKKTDGEPTLKPSDDPSKRTPEKAVELATKNVQDTEQTQSESPLFDDAAPPSPIEENKEPLDEVKKNEVAVYMETVSYAIDRVMQMPESITLKDREVVNDKMRKLREWLGQEYKTAQKKQTTGSKQ